MDAKELTKKVLEMERDISFLKVQNHELKMQVFVLENRVKDLSALEGAVDQHSKRLISLEQQI